MSRNRDPSRRIPQNLGSAETFYGYKTKNIGVAAVPLGIAVFITNTFQIPLPYVDYAAPALGALIGWLILYATPNHLSSREWVESYVHYFKQPDEIHLENRHYDMAREQVESPTDAEADIFTVDRETQELTHVNRVHKDAHAVEREDNTVVGAVKVQPANMALSSDRLWEQMVDEFESYLNNVVDYKIQIYATTRRFPIDEYTAHYEDRMNDPDVKNRPILQELLADFLGWYPEYLNYQGTNQREYYIIVTVDRDEIYGLDRDEKSIFEKLAELPAIGGFFESFIDQQREKTDAEKLQEQLRELNKRCKNAERHGARSLTGVSARRVSGAELAILLKEYWGGSEVNLDPEAVIRDAPVQQGDGAVSTEEVSNTKGYEGTTSSESN